MQKKYQAEKHQSGYPCNHHLDRRDFLALGAVTGAGLILPKTAFAADNIRDLQGTAYVNRTRATKDTPIYPGDTVTVAHGGRLSFVVGKDAYLLRGGSSLFLEKDENFLVKGLNLFTGGLLAVFGKGNKTIRTRNATMGIRGTGIYLNTQPDETYFCTCYGEVEVSAGSTRTIVKSTHHESMWIRTPKHGETTIERMGMFMGSYQEHTDEELQTAEALVGRTTPF